MSALGHVTPGEIIARLESELDDRPSVLAFDADGTLWRGDVSCDVYAGAVRHRAFREEARGVLERDALELGLDASGPLEAIAERLLAAHLRGHWEDGPAAIGMAEAWAGHGHDEAIAFAGAILSESKLRERTHPGVEAIIAWARKKGVRVLVVSASPIAIVYAAIRHLDVAEEDVVAMKLAVGADGKYQPRIHGANVYGEGKVGALEERRAGRRVLGAFGDSFGDRFMLRLAKVPVAVGPTARLLEEAHTIEGLSVLPFPPETR